MLGGQMGASHMNPSHLSNIGVVMSLFGLVLLHLNLPALMEQYILEFNKKTQQHLSGSSRRSGSCSKTTTATQVIV